MSSPEIRPAIEADLPFVTEIYAHAVLHGTATFELTPPDLAEMTRRYRVLMDGAFPYLVAVLDGIVVGYAYAGAYRPRPAYRFRQMIAVIGDSANAGSIGMHRACGFQMIGTHPNVGLKFGRWLDTVMMQLALGEGGSAMPAALAPD